MIYQGMFKEPENVVVYLAFLGTILLPMALIRLCLPSGWQPAAPFFAIQLACAIVTFFCVACDNAVHTHLKSVCAILPLSVLIMAPNDTAWQTTSRMSLMAIATGGSLILLLLSMRKPLLEMCADERASLDQPAPAELAALPRSCSAGLTTPRSAACNRGCKPSPGVCGCRFAITPGAAKAGTGRARASAARSIFRITGNICPAMIPDISTGRRTRAPGITR